MGPAPPEPEGIATLRRFHVEGRRRGGAVAARMVADGASRRAIDDCKESFEVATPGRAKGHPVHSVVPLGRDMTKCSFFIFYFSTFFGVIR